MIPAPSGFSDAIHAKSRAIRIFMHVGVGIDNTAADDIASINASRLPMSLENQLVDATYETTKRMATWEGDGIPTAVANRMRAPPKPGDVHNMEIGLWSDVISGADGTIDWMVTIKMNRVHKSALTVFSREVKIMKAEVSFIVGGAVQYSEVVDSTADKLQVDSIHDYDEVHIRVLKIDKPYHHVRVTEVEFGASVTLSGSSLVGSVQYISQMDRTGATCPLYEVQATILNKDSIYDFDSPSTTSQVVSVGKPLLLSYQVELLDGSFVTIPCGRFYIRTIDMGDGTATITADDARVLLTDVMRVWSIPIDKSIGVAMDELCQALFIPHVCDAALYSMYPPREIVFEQDTTFMEDVLHLIQLMGLEMVPEYDGAVHFRPYASGGEYGVVQEGSMFSYPQRQSNLRAYNIVAVGYGQGTDRVVIDLRQDVTLQSVSQLYIRNPLLQTRDEAQRVADHVVSMLHNEELDVDWIGDPTLEVGDTIAFPGRWSGATPRRVLMQTITFDGGLSAKTTMIM